MRRAVAVVASRAASSWRCPRRMGERLPLRTALPRPSASLLHRAGVSSALPVPFSSARASRRGFSSQAAAAAAREQQQGQDAHHTDMNSEECAHPSTPAVSLLGVRTRPLLVFDLPGPHPYAPVWRWQQQRVRDKVTAERAITKAARTAVHIADTTLQSTLLVHSAVPELQEVSDVLDLNGGTSAAVTNPETELLRSGLADVLLLLEHAPVYTLGRNASLAHLRFPPHVRVRVAERGELTSTTPAAAETAAAGQVPPIDDAVDFELLRVERGGEVTFHGPGQLMIYPLLALNPSPILDPAALASGGLSQQAGVSPFRPDLHWFLRSLESVVIRFLQLYDVQGERLPGASGVWVRLEDAEGDASGLEEAATCTNGTMSVAAVRAAAGLHKIAALGLSCSGWVSMHGCALNIDCPLQPFDFIVPCGLEDRSKFAGVTSLQQVLQRRQNRLLLNPATTTNGATRARGTGQQGEVVRLDHAHIRQQILQCFREEFQLSEPMAICTQLPDS